MQSTSITTLAPVIFAGQIRSSITKLSNEEVELAAKALVKPTIKPENIWEVLTDRQKVSGFLSRFAARIEGGSYGKELDSLDWVNLLIQEGGISTEAISITDSLLGSTYSDKKNPTILKLLEYVNNQVSQNEPLSIVVSQCIEKEPQIREQKLSWFTRPGDSQVDVSKFGSDFKAKGWGALRALALKTGYPVRLTIILGDMDFLTIDGGSLWASANSQQRLKEEMVSLKGMIEKKAQDFFGEVQATVQLWSEYYTIKDFSDSLRRAQNEGIWVNQQSLVGNSLKMYLDILGYRELGEKQGISDETLKMFIVGDIVRTAAQYRLEANLIQERQVGIQVWAEKVCDPSWPIKISAYDGGELPPSLVLSI